jgi:hypothetical protein
MSMMKAMLAKPCYVATNVKSATHKAFGQDALNCRFTWQVGTRPIGH